jgi:hypothetical protein
MASAMTAAPTGITVLGFQRSQKVSDIGAMHL